MNNDDKHQSEKAYVYDIAANGIEVRIPLDQYESWKAAQDCIRKGDKSVVNPETVKQLAALMKGEETTKEIIDNTIVRKQRPNVFLSIIFSLLAVVAFYIVATISIILFSVLIHLISIIPILKFLTNVFLANSGGFLMDIIYGVCAYLAVAIVGFISEKIIKKEPTRNLSLMITGIILVIMNVLFLIINLILGHSVIANIIFGIAGFILFHSGKELN